MRLPYLSCEATFVQSVVEVSNAENVIFLWCIATFLCLTFCVSWGSVPDESASDWNHKLHSRLKMCLYQIHVSKSVMPGFCFQELPQATLDKILTVDTIGVGADKFLGVPNIFARISPNIAENFSGNSLCEYFLPHRSFLGWPPKKGLHVILPRLGANLSKSNNVGHHY